MAQAEHTPTQKFETAVFYGFSWKKRHIVFPGTLETLCGRTLHVNNSKTYQGYWRAEPFFEAEYVDQCKCCYTRRVKMLKEA
tara:strand:+ start:141 stop:386 length:246 start_codon:yes stop_codon:yes gene_type:complete